MCLCVAGGKVSQTANVVYLAMLAAARGDVCYVRGRLVSLSVKGEVGCVDASSTANGEGTSFFPCPLQANITITARQLQEHDSTAKSAQDVGSCGEDVEQQQRQQLLLRAWGTST